MNEGVVMIVAVAVVLGHWYESLLAHEVTIAETTDDACVFIFGRLGMA